MNRRISLIVFLLLWFGIGKQSLWATHNLAGQITYKKINENQYEIVLTTYTNPNAAGVDRCTADIEIWGFQDGNWVFIDKIKDIPRENGNAGNCANPSRMGVFVRPNFKRNIYRTIRSFDPGRYSLRYFDVA
ncbi:MAG: hypothetical protein NZ108_05500, partial [Bacteroidia bacterium]|nr:hypothetical protein [Bacteroidia bacterium]